LIFTLGVARWPVYGLVIGAWPVLDAYAMTLLLAPFILGKKPRYG
jgi:MtN3 and saliva related transmembrane protein